jgi:hypothetical protein
MALTKRRTIGIQVPRLVKNEPRPRLLARLKVHRITLLRPVGTGDAGKSGMAEAILVALLSLLLRAIAAVTAATCACFVAPRQWWCKRAGPTGKRRDYTER